MASHQNNKTNTFGNSMKKVNFGDLPIGEYEDVEFSEEFADEDDREAQERARAADQRMRNGE